METFKALFSKTSIEDIVLAPRGTLIFEQGQWRQENEHCPSVLELWDFARLIAENSNTELGLTNPSVDSFWSDQEGNNFRVHVAIHPLVLRGPEITLRRIPKINYVDLESFQVSDENKTLLIKAVLEGSNILISGSTGSGKTSFLTALMSHIPSKLRVLVLEDSPELTPPTPFSTKLLSRKNRFGFRQGANWDLEHLVFESLRMRPDRIVLGECRGSEAFAIVSALQTGHQGIMTTIHAGSARESLERFHQLAESGGLPAQNDTNKLWDLLIHLKQNSKGERHVDEVVSRPSQ